MKRISTLMIAGLLLSGALMAFSSVEPVTGAVTFTADPVLVRETANVKESLSMGAGDDGRIYLSWSERINDNTDIMFSYSSNNGTTFSQAARVNRNTNGSQSSSELATAGDTVYIVWEDSSSDSGDIILGTSEDGGVSFNETHVSNYENGTQSSPSIAASGSNVAVAWEEYRSDNSIRIWKGIDGTLIRKITGHQAAVRETEFSPNGTYLASGSEDKTVRIWNSATGTLFRNITAHNASVTAINWSADGKMLATGSDDKNVIIFNTSTFAEIQRLNQVDGIYINNYVSALSFSPDSGSIVVAYNGRFDTASVPSGFPTQDFNVTVWDLENSFNWTANGLTPDPNKGHSNSVMDAAFSHDGNLIATGSKDKTLKIWDSSNGLKIQDINLGQPVYSLAWSLADTHIAAGLGNGSIAIVNVSNPADIILLEGTHTGRVNALDWSLTGNEIASGASDPMAKIWYSEAIPLYYGVEHWNLSGHMNSIYGIDWTTDGQRLVTAGGVSSQYGFGENQIFCAVSDDGGITFSSPSLVSDSCSSNRLRPEVSVNSAGLVSVAWYDSRIGDQNIYFANSTDGGASFSRNIAVVKDIGEDVTPDVLVDESGTSHVVWQYGVGTATGIRYANTTDSFAHARTMDATTAQIPHITGSPDGSSLWVTWRYKNYTTGVSSMRAAVSYNGGSAFNENLTLNSTMNFMGEHALAVDIYNQTYAAWDVMESTNRNVYFQTTVLADVWRPYCVSSYPANGGTNVSIFTGFTIRFSEPMNRTVTQLAFSWTDGALTWTVHDCVGNQGIWSSYGDSVVFTPKTPLLYQKSDYIMKINTTAKDLAGNFLLSNLTAAFTTGADLDPPQIEHYPSQSNVSYDQEYHVMALVTDQWGTVDNDSVWLHFRGVSDSAVTRQVKMNETYADTYLATIPAQGARGIVYYYIEAADEFGNTGQCPINYTIQSQLYNFTVIDGVLPEIRHESLQEFYVGDDIEIPAYVDDILLLNVSLSYTGVDMVYHAYVPMEQDLSDGTLFKATIPAQTNIGEIEYNISAYDESGNFNITTQFTALVIDQTVPLINSVIPEYLENQTMVRIRANVTDNVAVQTVTLYYKAVGGDIWVQREMPNAGGDYYEFTIPAQDGSGVIYYYVNATDTSGNQASTIPQQGEYEIEVVGVGPNYTLYIILGAVLAVLLVVLVFLVIRKYSKPAEADEPLEDDGPVNVPGKDDENP